MGGNLFKTSRLARAEYFKLKAELLPIIKEYFEDAKVPFETPGKADFGDLDILVVSKQDGSSNNFNPSTHTKINSPSISKEGGQLHFIFRDFQVDLIYTPKEALAMAMYFYSFADYGMIMGKLVTRAEFNFKPDGLYTKALTRNPRAVPSILLTNEPKEVSSFLGVDHSKWENGFETEQEVFDFILSSKFFRLPSMTKTNERPMINRFLSYCDAKSLSEIQLQSFTADEKDKMFQDALNNFGKMDEYKAIVAKIEASRAVKAKFHGGMVKDWTGLTGKDLCEFLTRIKPIFTDVYILQASPEELKLKVLELFKQ
jgi:hypothetical protein